jgi:hypothetical protein
LRDFKCLFRPIENRGITESGPFRIDLELHDFISNCTFAILSVLKRLPGQDGVFKRISKTVIFAISAILAFLEGKIRPLEAS